MVEGRDFWLGGVLIPSPKGALGHSDADVLLHAVCDALLGALALGDIGQHFPDTDAAYKGIDSKILLKKCGELVASKGYAPVNIDATVLLEAPKIKKYGPDMRATMAAVLNMSPNDISIKATTTEQMGFVGKGEGIVAMANVLLRQLG